MIYGWHFLFACRRLKQYSQPINYSECHLMSHKALCALISWKWLQIEGTSVCSGAVSDMFEPFHGFWQLSYLSPAPEFSASILAQLIIKPFRSEAFAQYARMLPLQSAVTRALFSYNCKQKILIIVSFSLHCLREAGSHFSRCVLLPALNYQKDWWTLKRRLMTRKCSVCALITVC